MKDLILLFNEYPLASFFSSITVLIVLEKIIKILELWLLLLTQQNKNETGKS
jgi:hypothetical protein